MLDGQTMRLGDGQKVVALLGDIGGIFPDHRSDKLSMGGRGREKKDDQKDRCSKRSRKHRTMDIFKEKRAPKPTLFLYKAQVASHAP
jgi:hypothetical protein